MLVQLDFCLLSSLFIPASQIRLLYTVSALKDLRESIQEQQASIKQSLH